VPLSSSRVNRSHSSLIKKETRVRNVSPCLSTAKTDKLDMSGFVKFLIQLSVKCLPKVDGGAQTAVVILVEKFMLPLLDRQNDSRSVQNTFLTKLL
jgi:hypothetical protein